MSIIHACTALISHSLMAISMREVDRTLAFLAVEHSLKARRELGVLGT